MKKENGEAAWRRLEAERKKRSSIEGLAGAALEGDTEAALQMIQYADDFIWNSNDVPDAVKFYVCRAFTDILNGESPDKAFLLAKRTSGRGYDHWKEVRDADIARGVKYHVDQGMKVRDAIEKIKESYTGFLKEAGGVGSDTIKKAFNRYFSSVKGKK